MENTNIDLHSLGGDGGNPGQGPQGFSDFNWMAVAWAGALKHMDSTLLSQYEDSNVLEGAANLVQAVGASSVTYYVDQPSLNDASGNPLVGNYTIAQLIQAQGAYASQGSNNGNSRASVVQSLIGQAQSEMSNRVQIGQQYVTQETNLATSTDPQASSQAGQELSALNNALAQWAQLNGAFG